MEKKEEKKKKKERGERKRWEQLFIYRAAEGLQWGVLGLTRSTFRVRIL